MFDKMVQGLGKLGKSETVRAPTKLKENYRPERKELANAIRALAMDAVQKAKSGHPGAPMGMADIAEVLWNGYLRHNPANPRWSNRDRFVMSNGHGSMLLYALLHLSGYDVTIEDLTHFRQLHSRTPGHPEFGLTPGIETTTGPLGQGLANGVGMALAERVLSAQFNREGFNIVDHYTYVAVGDGCLMEGISHEACSLAGALGLGKLIVLYDDNQISIDGDVRGWFADDTRKRFESYRWQVLGAVDGHDAGAVAGALEKARTVTDKPSLVILTTTIGYGAPQAGTAVCHGAPLGPEAVAATRVNLDWLHAEFVIPGEIYAAWDGRARGAELEAEWNALFARYRHANPELADEFERRLEGRLPDDWEARARSFIAALGTKSERIATRKASQNALCAYGPLLRELIGGSADLTESNLTLWKGANGLGSKVITRQSSDGNYVHYGVREFGMSAIMNGIALHGGFIPYGGTFLVFSDYARNAVRMAALMKAQSIFVYTHDSIGLGEDGPTHQAVEHATSLRLIPNLRVWRPCDPVETAVAWKLALEHRHGPTALLLTRQAVTPQPRSPEQIDAIGRGAYVLSDCQDRPQVILLATGSEVELATGAASVLSRIGVRVRVVSMPSTQVFDAQDRGYREAVLPRDVRARIAIEAGATDFWFKYVGLDGRVIGLDSFGESAPSEEVLRHFGFNVEHVIEEVRRLLA